jgi:hypothetical protein
MRRAIGKVHASGTPEHRAIGAIFPALPGVTNGFTLLEIDSERVLTLVPVVSVRMIRKREPASLSSRAA